MADVGTDDFRKELDEFLRWTSKSERPLSCWFTSLESWASGRFNEEYRKEHPKS